MFNKNSEYYVTYLKIVNEIVEKFKAAEKNSEIRDGLIIYKEINLPFLSKVTWYASEFDTCTDKSIGTKESCLLKDGTAVCQSIELNIKYKSLCVESFSK